MRIVSPWLLGCRHPPREQDENEEGGSESQAGQQAKAGRAGRAGAKAGRVVRGRGLRGYSSMRVVASEMSSMLCRVSEANARCSVRRVFDVLYSIRTVIRLVLISYN